MFIKTGLSMLGLCVLLMALCACAAEESSASLKTPGSGGAATLFYDTEAVGEIVSAPHIVRSRFVKVNFSLLMGETGQPAKLEANSEITLNLFPDVTYTGVIDRVEKNGDEYSWVGHLKNVEYSELTMLVTGGIFIAHFASPGGVYEVSSAGDDLYQITMIDQQKLPGGE